MNFCILYDLNSKMEHVRCQFNVIFLTPLGMFLMAKEHNYALRIKIVLIFEMNCCQWQQGIRLELLSILVTF